MVRIVVDSTSDLTNERIAELGVTSVPLFVHFGEETYLDGVNLSAEEFYVKMEEREWMAKTAQPSPEFFEKAFRSILDDGDDVLAILVSSGVSGTVQSANVAKSHLESGHERVMILDTQTCTSGLALLVEIAAKKAKEGMGLQELHDEIERLSKRTKVFAAIETLKYVKRGGRLSGPAAIVGTMLNLHPIMAMKNGEVINITAVKGKKRMYQKLRQYAMEHGVDKSYPMFFSHGVVPERMEKMRECFAEKFDMKQALFGIAGCIVGTYSGPGILIFAFIEKGKGLTNQST
ncbi:DegV family protein [Chakrabartyella piscis]|uniref:DegV family protein n=1 Tax=Chakrabartyella piscis TaxID=2918914 RepID=UPI002958836B|nr:DegV family protein [Chakrabartyella piscis]